MDRPTKITFADMREQGVRGLLIYCADYRCSHSIAINGDRWPDDVRLSDIELSGCLTLSRGLLCWFFIPDDLSTFATKKSND